MATNSCLSSPYAEHNHWLTLKHITQGFRKRRNPPRGSANILIRPSHTQLATAPQNLNPNQFLYSTAKTYAVNIHAKQLTFYVYKMHKYQFSCDPINCYKCSGKLTNIYLFLWSCISLGGGSFFLKIFFQEGQAEDDP